jgi:D-alanyl-D-alanine carboxypeptidase
MDLFQDISLFCETIRKLGRPRNSMKKLELSLLLAAVALCGQALPKIPDTPAGKVFARWLDVFNRGQRAELQEFLAKYLPDRSVDDELGFREQTGGFDLNKIETATDTKVTGIVQERAGSNYAKFLFEVDAAEPHRIANIGLQVIPRPGEAPPLQRLSEADAISALKAELEQGAAEGRFSGAALVAHKGKPIFVHAYGLADREHNISNRPDTRFRIGSMNKMFTATAVLQLAQAGKIQLNDPVGKYLTDYPNRDIATKVTIHHLLTHTGGTGDFFGPEFDKHRLELKDLRDYIQLYGQRGPEFEPGSKHVYSNYGFLLLGVVIERVSGQSYYEYVRQQVFQPAGMKRTDSLTESEPVEERSVGYMKKGGRWVPNTGTLPFRGTSAGGGYSTVEDLLAFANALTTHKLLDAEHTTLLMTGKVDAMPGIRYAYGFMDSKRDAHWFGHGGGAPGMNGELRIYPDSGYVIAVLANLDPPAATRVADFIGERLPSEPRP